MVQRPRAPRYGTVPPLPELFLGREDVGRLLRILKKNPTTFGLPFMHSQWQTDDPKPTAKEMTNCGLLEAAGTKRFQMHALLVTLAYSMLQN